MTIVGLVLGLGTLFALVCLWDIRRRKYTKKRRVRMKAKGFFIQLNDTTINRVIFSATVPDLSEEAFMVLWAAVGKHLYAGTTIRDTNQPGYYEIRVTPIIN